jgi:hypothetical protein
MFYCSIPYVSLDIYARSFHKTQSSMVNKFVDIVRVSSDIPVEPILNSLSYANLSLAIDWFVQYSIVHLFAWDHYDDYE